MVCVVSPVVFDLWVREEVVYEMAAAPRSFIVSSCGTKGRGGSEELRREGKDVVAVKMVDRPISFSKVRNRRPDCCGNIAA